MTSRIERDVAAAVERAAMEGMAVSVADVADVLALDLGTQEQVVKLIIAKLVIDQCAKRQVPMRLDLSDPAMTGLGASADQSHGMPSPVMQ